MAEIETSKHRSKCRILADILHALERNKRAKITYLIHEANLPYGRLMDYLASMEQSGLIEKMKNEFETFYFVTEKGKTYLIEFKKFEEFGNIFGVEI